MFCPKCGAQSLASDQRYCKSCGTNLKAVNDVMEKGDGKTSVLSDIVKSVKDNVDVEGIVESVKKTVGEVTVNKDLRRRGRRVRHSQQHRDNLEHWLEVEKVKTQVEEEKAKRQQLRVPKPKEWMSYSWQHNLRSGLMSLLGGAGLGVFLYFLGKTVIEAGILQELQQNPDVHLNGVEPLIRMVWLFALIPMLKGIGQIFYAAFFAESMATLSERFATRELPLEKSSLNNLEDKPQEKFLFSQPSAKDTAPHVNTNPIFEEGDEAPPSVTETTTRTLKEARAKRGQYE